MKGTTRITLAAAVAAIAFSGLALAQTPDETLKATGCFNCHEKDKKKVGPAFKDVVARGVKADDVVPKMIAGKGHPKQTKPEAELKKAVEAALSTK